MFESDNNNVTLDIANYPEGYTDMTSTVSNKLENIFEDF